MLSELYHYISQNPKPGDAESVKQCMLYLEACNKLFENGFLTHQRIFDLDSCVLRSIHEGYTYFCKWYDELSAKGIPSVSSFKNAYRFYISYVCTHALDAQDKDLSAGKVS